ncbi:hypothetical protein M1558_03130 [Candidatus Parvarchaeota archaeon]|nr:hypothetical protein [Candidatus Parvarchaeota archaeon]
MSKLLKVGVIDINTNKPHYSSLEKTLNVLEKARQFDLDMIIGPEWGLMDNQVNFEAPYSYRELKKLFYRLKNATKGTDELAIAGTAVIYTKNRKMYNFLPVIYGGNVIFSTIKTTDGGTSFFNNGNYELIGRDYSIANDFEWKNLKIGIEICADSGTLRRQGKKDLDLQILVSSGIRITNLAVKKGGYLICSDGVPKGKKTYVIKTNENYNPDLNIDLADFIGLFKRREINYQLMNSNNKKMPFEFVSPYSKHQNLSVYRLLIDD